MKRRFRKLPRKAIARLADPLAPPGGERVRERGREIIPSFRPLRRSAGPGGYLLLETLVFMALSVVILGIASAAYWRCVDNSKQLHRNAEDILAAVDAGERWRSDIRLAERVVAETNLATLTQAGDTVEYRFEHEAIWRHSSRAKQTIRLLASVKSSSMQSEARAQIHAWRWEIELQSRKKPPYLRPLFTFEAVAAK